MGVEKDLDRASKAKRLLNDSLLQEAFAKITENLHKKFEESQVSQKEEREEIYRMLHVTREVKRHLENVLNTGKMAERILEDNKRKLK